MAVDDHGLEVLKKSGEEVVSGDKADYYIKTSTVDNSKNAYGDLSVTSKRHFIDAAPVYNLIPSNFRQFSLGTGSSEAVNHEFKTSTGVDQFSYGAIRSFRSLNVRYGESASVRFGARFPDSVANSWQGVGLFNIGDEASFGMNGTDFGVWHRYGGKAEIRELQITSGASGGETATITVNDEVFNVPITSGSAQLNAHEISQYLNVNATAFTSNQIDDVVEVYFLSDGAKNGTYSFTSSSATGVFSQVTAGITKTSDFVKLSDFNGSVPADFDSTKGNQYSISFQYGYGPINFYIYDQVYQRRRIAHTVLWQSNNNGSNFTNPSMHAGLYCVSIGSTTNISTYCSHISAFVDGDISPVRNPRSEENTKSLSTTKTVIFQIRNKRVYNGEANQAEIDPKILTISNESSKNCEIRLRGNPTVGGTPNFQEIGTNLISEIDTSSTTASGGRKLTSFVVGPGQNQIINLETLKIRIPPTLTVAITGRFTGTSSSEVTAALTWIEDI